MHTLMSISSCHLCYEITNNKSNSLYSHIKWTIKILMGILWALKLLYDGLKSNKVFKMMPKPGLLIG